MQNIARHVKNDTGIEISTTLAVQTGYVGIEIGKYGLESSNSETTLAGISENKLIKSGEIIDSQNGNSPEDRKTEIGGNYGLGGKYSQTVSHDKNVKDFVFSKESKAVNVGFGPISIEIGSQRDIKSGKFQNHLEVGLGVKAGLGIGGEASIKGKVTYDSYEYNSPRTNSPQADTTRVQNNIKYVKIK